MDDPPTASTFTAKARAAIVDLDAPVALREEDAATDESGAECLRSYLVLGRLFKLHPKFDLAIEGILAGDVDGCVILIHETRDEEWTRAVWSRLRDSLVPQGAEKYHVTGGRHSPLRLPCSGHIRLYRSETIYVS